MVTIFMMNEEIARGMVCFFHQKKHSYLINEFIKQASELLTEDPGFESRQGIGFWGLYAVLLAKLHMR
jgi:hypothetical protein